MPQLRLTVANRKPQRVIAAHFCGNHEGVPCGNTDGQVTLYCVIRSASPWTMSVPCMSVSRSTHEVQGSFLLVCWRNRQFSQHVLTPPL
jgi:hypothetical protein